MGSTSLGAASGSGDSLIGLKFGQKIYFEDVGGGGTASASSASASASAGSSSAAAASTGEVLATSGKKGRGATQGSQPPRCQVEGCQVDLTGAKAYYCRHKVCGMHSKSPMVIVAGLEQRFCQQCSRFHQLREFDQGKRSCRRRLAGHNERRRKPPPGSFVAPHHARKGSSFHDTSKVGSFLDFSYSRLPGRDVWPPLRVAEHGASSQLTSTGKYLPNLFQGGYGVSTSNIVSHAAQSYLQGSSVGTMFPGAEIPAGEAFAGVSGSGCALSLLSNQQWDPRSRGSSLNNLMNDGRTHTSQTTSHAPVPTQFISNAWSFKEHGSGGSSNNLSLQQVQGSSNSQFSAAREFPQHEGRQYMDPGQSRGHESSSHQMNWSL